MIQTKNFNPISDPKLLCTCGHPECDKRSVKQEVLDTVQIIRERVGRPLTITSGGRCPRHQDEQGRIKPADHQKCIAVDIYVNNGIERSEIVKMGVIHGANAIGVAASFVHLGWRNSDVDVMWVY